jgi:hypothetical protein
MPQRAHTSETSLNVSVNELGSRNLQPYPEPRTLLNIHSQLTPERVSRGYFSILPGSHLSCKICNIREFLVTHNPKVVGSNPTPATIGKYWLSFPFRS